MPAAHQPTVVMSRMLEQVVAQLVSGDAPNRLRNQTVSKPARESLFTGMSNASVASTASVTAGREINSNGADRPSAPVVTQPRVRWGIVLDRQERQQNSQ